MKKVIQGASLLIVIFIPGIVGAGEIAEDSFDKLMALSGLNKQMAEFPGVVRAGLEQAKRPGAPIADAEFGEVQRSIEDAFQPSGILSVIDMEIKNNISESEVKDLLTWYESDLGRKITKAEENASTPAAYQEMIEEAQSLLTDEKRVKLAGKIESLVNVTDMTMRLQENAGVAVFTAISTVMDPDRSVNNIEAFKAQMSAQEQQMRANIEEFVILSFVYSYKDIDMASIEKYVKFLERPNTRKFNDSVIKGMNYALNQSIGKMAESLAVVVKKYDEQVDK